MDAHGGISTSISNSIHLQVPSLTAHLVRDLAPTAACVIPLRKLFRAADGLAGLVDGALRSLPQLGAAKLADIMTKAHDPAALTRALASRILSDASAETLAAIEMSGRLGYAHARFRALAPAVARSARDPWWVPLAADWVQVNPAWQEALVDEPIRAADSERSACLSRLVADLVDEGAVHEAIEVCIDAGWQGLAADLIAGEAERLESAGRHATLIGWLMRLSADETRSHSGLATLALDWQQAMRPENHAETGQWVATSAMPSPRRPHRIFRRLSSIPADTSRSRVQPPLSSAAARPSQMRQDPVLPTAARLAAAPDSKRLGETTLRQATPASQITGMPSPQPLAGATTEHKKTSDITAHLLGELRVAFQDRPVEIWSSGRGRAVLAYLLVNRHSKVRRDRLMSMFWPEASPDAARNSLNVAIHGLRQSLRAAAGDAAVVIHKDQAYFIDPTLDVWVDIEAFEEQLKAAHQHLASEELVKAERAFEAATWLYQGEFLADDPYEEWAIVAREQLRLCYLDALDRLGALRLDSGDYVGCIAVCLKLLAYDSCREDAHCRLMRCYSRQGQAQLALRQYHSCVTALRTELDVAPASATIELFDRLHRRESI